MRIVPFLFLLLLLLPQSSSCFQSTPDPAFLNFIYLLLFHHFFFFFQTDIQYWDDTLTEEIQVIQSQLDRVPGLRDGVEKAGAIDKLKKKIRGAKGTKRSFKMEIRLVQDVNQRRKYESRLSSLDQQLQKLVSDCKAIEAENNRGELFVGGGDGGGGDGVNGMNGEEGGDKMLSSANQLQDKTQDSLSNTKNMITQSKEVGMATLEELERQRGVIENIDSEADRIDDNLARAEKLVRSLGFPR